jgi:hypothetical protein
MNPIIYFAVVASRLYIIRMRPVVLETQATYPAAYLRFQTWEECSLVYLDIEAEFTHVIRSRCLV